MNQIENTASSTPKTAPAAQLGPNEIDDSVWFETYRTITNTNPETRSGPSFSDADGTMRQIMFETFGQDLQHVRDAARTAPNTVWTLIDCGNYEVIVAGMALANRLGYFITEKPWTDENMVAVDPEYRAERMNDDDDADEGFGDDEEDGLTLEVEAMRRADAQDLRAELKASDDE